MMENAHKVRIELTGDPRSRGTKIFLDGVMVNCVTAFKVEASIKDVTRVTIELLAGGVEVEGVAAEVIMKEST